MLSSIVWIPANHRPPLPRAVDVDKRAFHMILIICVEFLLFVLWYVPVRGALDVLLAYAQCDVRDVLKAYVHRTR